MDVWSQMVKAQPGGRGWSLAIEPQPLIRPIAIRLFLLAAAYIAIPYGDIPFIGLSLSAPLMYLVALEVFLQPAGNWMHRYRRWMVWGGIIWVGAFLSDALNRVLRGGADLDTGDIVMLLRYAYWLLLVFPVTVYLISELNLGRRTIRAMAIAIVLTGLVRWWEALAWGKIGAWTQPFFFTQNMYGILFSTFSPLLLALLVDPKTKHRVLVVVGILIVWTAAAINGSRGSWVALAIGALLFVSLYFWVNPTKVRGLIWIVFLCIAFVGLMQVAPEWILEPVRERYATLQNLKEDKTYNTRRFLVQKGIILFQRSPFIGVGLDRWDKEYVVLELPDYLKLGRFNRITSHNSYIMFLAETGLMGTLPLVTLLIYLAVRGLQAAIRLARQEEYWALGIYVAFVTMGVHLWVLSGLTGTSTWMVYGMVAGIVERINRIQKGSEG